MSARAGVEQYCSAIHPASSTRSAGTPGGQHGVGLGQPFRRDLGLGGEPEHDPERRPPAERDSQERADADIGLLGAQPVVERPAYGPREGERLDAGDTLRAWRRGRASLAPEGKVRPG